MWGQGRVMRQAVELTGDEQTTSAQQWRGVIAGRVKTGRQYTALHRLTNIRSDGDRRPPVATPASLFARVDGQADEALLALALDHHQHALAAGLARLVDLLHHLIGRGHLFLRDLDDHVAGAQIAIGGRRAVIHLGDENAVSPLGDGEALAAPLGQLAERPAEPRDPAPGPPRLLARAPAALRRRRGL